MQFLGKSSLFHADAVQHLSRSFRGPAYCYRSMYYNTITAYALIIPSMLMSHHIFFFYKNLGFND